MAGLIVGSALAPVAKKIIPGLKNGGGAVKTSSNNKALRKKLKSRVDPGMIHTGSYRVMKKGGKVKRGKRRGRVKR